MKTRRVVYAALLLAALSAFGYDYWRRMENHDRDARMAAQVKDQAARQRAIHEMQAAQPRPDDLERAWPAKLARPQSTWRTNERASYEAILTKERFDTLVVPFQVQAGGLDRATRSLMTAQLARAVALITGGRVPDPYLVARALGDGDRRLDPADVRRLAGMLGVSRIVYGHVGHQRRLVRLVIHEQASAQGESWTEMATPYFSETPLSDEDPPIEAYQKLLPQILTALRLDPAALPQPQIADGHAVSALPASPFGLAGTAGGPADEVYFNHLLGLLTPQHAERTRERFFEKAMLAVLSLSPQSANYNVLKARAYLHLGFRVAGLKMLGTPQTAEAKHVLGMLNGNLPEVTAPRAAQDIVALVAQLEANELRAAYGTSQQKAAELVMALRLPGDLWPFFVGRSFTEWDDWAQYDNAMLKRALELELPVAGMGLEEMAAGAFGDMGKLQHIAHFSVLDHATRLRGDAAAACCGSLARPEKSDYVDLVSAIGVDNLARQARFLTKVQAAPERALDFLGAMEAVFKDHPQFTVARAEAEWTLSQTSDGAQRAGLAASARMHAFNAWFWEQGQTRTAARAYFVAIKNGADVGFFDNLYCSDYPYRPFYPDWQAGFVDTIIANARAQLSNSSFNAWPVQRLTELLTGQGQLAELDVVLAGLEGRFAGEPRVPLVLAKMSARKGSMDVAETHYRKAMAAQPDHWAAYLELGKMFFEEGATEKAAAVMGAFPGFKSPSAANPVGLAHHASDAGSLLYWVGEFALAAPFYRIAAELRTGSDSSMSSAIRLALIDGDYRSALEGSLQRGQRYNSTYAFRDYLGMLHAMGHEKDAWNGFSVLISQVDRPHVWETALVGHRRAGASEQEIAAWSEQEPMRRAGRNFDYAAMYLARAAVTDRTPSDALPAKLAELARPVWKLNEGTVVRESLDGKQHFIVGPAAPNDGYYLPIGVFERSGKQSVKSDLVYFAEAYRALGAGDFGKSAPLLLEAAAHYDMQNGEVAYLLPYLALAAGQSKQGDIVHALMARFPAEKRRFDYYLGLGVLQALEGKTAEAVKSLRIALHRRPFTENRVLFTEFQYADICERLYEATRKPEFRDLALDWARKNRVFQPWFAWSHAMVAKLAPEGRERRQAMAMAYYLDRNSERLSTLPLARVKSAAKEFAANNPFTAGKPITRDRI